MHARDVAAAPTLLKAPAAQAVHTSAVLAAGTVAHQPLAHDVHCGPMALAAAYLPGTQLEHTAEVDAVDWAP